MHGFECIGFMLQLWYISSQNLMGNFVKRDMAESPFLVVFAVTLRIPDLFDSWLLFLMLRKLSISLNMTSKIDFICKIHKPSFPRWWCHSKLSIDFVKRNIHVINSVNTVPYPVNCYCIILVSQIMFGLKKTIKMLVNS